MGDNEGVNDCKQGFPIQEQMHLTNKMEILKTHGYHPGVSSGFCYCSFAQGHTLGAQ